MGRREPRRRAFAAPLLLLLVLLTLAGDNTSAHPLPDTPIHAVKNVRSFGAVGDGVKDDTAAVQAAIASARYQHSNTGSAALYSPIVLYFPKGEYLVSDTLQLFPGNATSPHCCPPEGNLILGLIVMGEGKDLTTVKLQDSAAGYADKSRPKPVFLTFPGPRWNDGQHLGYFDITVNTGDNNPGAVGIDHLANNVGGSKNVHVQAGARGGVVGFDFWRDLGGITYLSHISVSGFDIGFNISGYMMTLPMEHCSVEGAEVGVAITEKGVQIRGFITRNVSKPIVATGNYTSLIVIDSTLPTAGGDEADGAVAIESKGGGQLFVRNVSTPGWSTAIITDRGPVADATQEYTYARHLSLFAGASSTSAALPIEDSPMIARDPPSEWAVVDLDAQEDDTAAIQAAIDSGKATVFLNGTESDSTITDTLVLRGAIRRLHGGWRRLIPPRHSRRPGTVSPPSFKALRFEVEDHPVAVEFLDLGGGIQHSSDGVLVLSYCSWGGKWTEASVDGYNNTKGGSVFLEGSQPKGATPSGHSVGPGIRLTPPHQMWARSLDLEGFQHSIQNDNAVLWVMGVKQGESEANPYLRLWGGGATEILGFVFNGGNRAGATAVVVHESDVTLVGGYSRFIEHNTTINETAHGHSLALECCNWTNFAWRNWTDPGIGDGEYESGFHLPFFRSSYATPAPFVPPLPAPTPPPPEPPPPAMPPQCKAQALKDCPGPFKDEECQDCLRNHSADLLAHDCPKGPKGVSYYGVIERICAATPKPPPGPPSPPGPPAPHGECPGHGGSPPPPLSAPCKAVLGVECPGVQGKGKACHDCLQSKRSDPKATAACPHKVTKTGASLCYTVTTTYCGNKSTSAMIDGGSAMR
jgi:hypothetical protein